MPRNFLTRLPGAGRALSGVGKAAALALIVLVLPLVSHAQSTTYSTSKRQFKVCNLLIESSTDADLNGIISPGEAARGPENPDPFVFYIADQRSDVKPQNWEFINPLAPKFVTSAIRARWVARDGSSADQYVVGQPLRKDMAAYWEVSLRDATIDQLEQYDLIFITNHRRSTFTPVEREKLRKVADGGGTVWVDNCGGMKMSWKQPFFLPDVQFGDRLGAGQAVVPRPDHPLLSSPYQLSFEEISKLGDKNLSSAILSTDPTNAGDEYASRNVAPNPETLVTIIGNNLGGTVLPYVSAGYYGSGAVIITASDVGCGINDNVGGTNGGSGGNSGGVSGKNFSAADGEDLKFLYNMVSWGTSNNTFRRNNRRTAASFDGIGSALSTAWNFDNRITTQFNPTAIVDSKSAPLIVNNLLVVSGVQGGRVTVRAYDLNPYNDADGDGNYDDGIPDVSLGTPYDEVWRYDGPNVPNGGYPSSPTFASVLVNRATGQRVDRIFVGTPTGDLISIDPQRNPNTGAYLAQPTTSVVSSTGGNGPYAEMPSGAAPSPAFFENRIYQVEPNGQLRCINAATGQVRWVTFESVPSGYTLAPTGSPTIGFARQTADGPATAKLSGGATSDLMLYMPANMVSQNGAPWGVVYAYWLGTRNEVAQPNNNGEVLTRIAGSQGNGVGAGQYFMAPGPDTDANSPFITPQARVYSRTSSNGVDYSAQEEYQNGVPSPDYTVSNIDLQTGKVTLNPTPPAGTDILVSIDYDVDYIRQGSMGSETPPNYTQQSPLGARPNQLLMSQNVLPGSPRGSLQTLPTTPAFAPTDTLLYTLTEAYRDSSGNQDATKAVTSIMGVNEQSGSDTNSKLPLRFSLFNNLLTVVSVADGGDGLPRFTRTVRNVSVSDEAPIVSYERFDANWPLNAANRAVRYPNAEPIGNLLPVGPPITTGNGITYFLCYGTSQRNQESDGNFGDNANSQKGPDAQADVAVLMAFRTNPNIVLNLPEPFSLNEGVTISQANVIGNPAQPDQPNLVEESTNQQTTARTELDPERGRITVNSLRTAGGGMFSASQSFVVQYTPRSGGARRTVIISPTPRNASNTYGQTADESGQVTTQSGGYTPLLWYSVLPGRPTSPATLIGDYIYYTMSRGTVGNFLITQDVQPEATDPTVRIGFGEPLLNTVPNLRDLTATPPDTAFVSRNTNHVRPAVSVPASGLEAPPVGGRGLLAVNSATGTFAYNAGTTLITEGNRLLEVDAASSPLWSLEGTLFNQVIGGQLPQYQFDPNNPNNVIISNPPATGRRAAERKSLSKPRLAQRISQSDYLIADTGNNRVVRTDRGGNILWSLAQFVDAYGVLQSGESTSLSGPTDAVGYNVPTLNSSGNQTGYEIHYLIADPGNYRIIEVADYYNLRGESIAAPDQSSAAAGDHVLVWTSRTTTEQGRHLRFTNVQRFLGVGPYGSTYAAYNGYPYITAVVANQTASQNTPNTDADTVGGSLVILSYQPYKTATLLRDGSNNPAVVNLWPAAAAGQNARTTEPTGNGTLTSAVEEVQIVQNGNRRAKRIVGPTYFRQLSLPTQGTSGLRERRLFLMCDAEAAYVVEARQDNNGKVVYDVLWYFGQADYDRMNFDTTKPAGQQRLYTTVASPVNLPKFQPMSLQLLGSGNFLVTNGYAGRSPLFESGQFVGEAFEVKPPGLSILSDQPYGSTQVGGTYGDFSTPAIYSGSVSGLLRQVMGQGVGTGQTGLLEQPTSAIRP